MLNVVSYREEVGELAVQQLLQLALVEFEFVSIVSRVVVENCDQCIHGTLELARHSAGRMRTSCSFLKMKVFKDLTPFKTKKVRLLT